MPNYSDGQTNIGKHNIANIRMTTFIKAKLKKWDNQRNIEKYKVASYIKECHITSKLNFHIIIIPKFIMTMQLFHVKMYVKMSKINMFKMVVWTFWSQLSSCYPFYIVLNCIRFHHTEYVIDRTSLCW